LVSVGVAGASTGGTVANPTYLRGLYEFTFTDSRVNSGNPTAAFLDMTAYGDASDLEVQIHRVIFDDSSIALPSGVTSADAAYPEAFPAVAEPGSNLALLALGAGGLTLRRRLKRAA
jgi:PEP-CTERM motif